MGDGGPNFSRDLSSALASSEDGAALPFVWHDREIRFNVPVDALAPIPGEYVIRASTGIEDSKGNVGEPGVLVVTNIRTTWLCQTRPTTNITIGHGRVLRMSIRRAARLNVEVQAFVMMTNFNNTGFEFVFSNLSRNPNPDVFLAVERVHAAFSKTRLFRDVQFRGSLLAGKSLLVFGGESVIREVSALNLATDQGQMGSFVVTNVRVVWYASATSSANVSIPFLQMKAARLRKSKFGDALVIEVVPEVGGYIVGFRIEPSDQQQDVAREVEKILGAYRKKPDFGVRIEDIEAESWEPPHASEADQDAITDAEQVDSFAVYATEGPASDQPVYDPELGLAVEPPPEGITPQMLWLGE